MHDPRSIYEQFESMAVFRGDGNCSESAMG